MPKTSVLMLAAVLLGLLLGASAQYIPATVPPGILLSKAGGSSATVFNSPTTDLVQLTVTLGPCSGLTPHIHNGSETNYADMSNKGNIKMGLIDSSNNYISADVKPGERFANPTGLLHYQYNPNCFPVTFIATLPIYTNFQAALSALQTIPASDYAVFATTPAANAIPGLFGTNNACVAACKQSNGGRRRF